jgi:serine/threonine protein kinase
MQISNIFAAADPAFRARFGVPMPLAEGGQGELYLALDREVACWSVLKLIRRSADSALLRALFEAEIAFASRLSAHPHVAQVLSAGRVGGRRYLELRHYGGGTLGAACEGPDALRAVDLICQILRALDYAHRIGIIHGDVSESQILLDDDGCHAVLADFGAARILPGFSAMAAMPPPLTGEVTLYIDPATVELLDRIERDIHARLMIVKFSHLAPERVVHGTPDPLWDVHAVAVTLFHLLTGHYPFEVAGVACGDFQGWSRARIPTVAEALRWSGRTGQPRWPAIEHAVDAVLARRLTSARQLLDALRSAEAEERWARREQHRTRQHRRWLEDERRGTPTHHWWRRRRLRRELARLPG